MYTKEDWSNVKFKLEMLAIKFLKDNYDMKLGIPIILNGRLKTTYGKFVHANRNSKKRASRRIEMSKTYIEHQPWDIVVETLKHELIHYALYELGKPYRDGESLFESELAKHGSHSTGTIVFKGSLHIYKCKNEQCGNVFERHRRYPKNGEGYTCADCGSYIYYDGRKLV
ncbi:SprT-like domain-containing protein [Bacillus mycoides]|uniref:SprT-like domain-containing protein n=1 Tax=Bacillus mycoides TaxID=1405 RepID=UPI003D032B57